MYVGCRVLQVMYIYIHIYIYSISISAGKGLRKPPQGGPAQSSRWSKGRSKSQARPSGDDLLSSMASRRAETTTWGIEPVQKCHLNSTWLGLDHEKYHLILFNRHESLTQVWQTSPNALAWDHDFDKNYIDQKTAV